MMTLTRSLLALVACFGAVAVGCSSSSTNASSSDDAENADSTEASASSSQTSRFDEMLYGPVQAQDPTMAATAVAAAQWWPAGCATRTHDATNPAVVKVSLKDCSGPFGLVHHTGDITITFSKGPGGELHAQAASSNMTVNGKAVTYSADADITVSGATRTVKYTGAWTREGAKGDTVSHTRQGTTVIDMAAKCRDTNGSAVTQVGNREVDSAIKDYKICRKADGTDGCPSGEIIHSHKLSGKTITFAFDGTAEAKVTGPKGNSIEVPLICIP
ncbi:MAG: hypothetical protein NVS3B10_20360 [Polyangiales bacterium]